MATGSSFFPSKQAFSQKSSCRHTRPQMPGGGILFADLGEGGLKVPVAEQGNEALDINVQRAGFNALRILALQAAQNSHFHLLQREAQRDLFAAVDTDLRREMQHALARRLRVGFPPGLSFDRLRSGCRFAQDGA